MERRWVVAYCYDLYLFLATLPQLTDIPPFGAGLPIFVLVALYVYHSLRDLGGLGALRFFVCSAGIGYLFEVVGVHTGFPFGEYHYNNSGGLGPELLGVPVTIPLLWATLSYFSYTSTRHPLASSLLMVVTDLTVDPLFSKFDWHWLTPGQYFGVPITNFLGWLLVSLTIFLLWDHDAKLVMSREATLFIGFLLFDLALQDYFSGLASASAASVSITVVTLTSLWVIAHRGPGAGQASLAT